jgi:hypothetical protein
MFIEVNKKKNNVFGMLFLVSFYIVSSNCYYFLYHVAQ